MILRNKFFSGVSLMDLERVFKLVYYSFFQKQNSVKLL